MSRDWPLWNLNPRQLCDIELMLNGAFSPLTGFLNQDDYQRVCREMKLSDDTLWPLPITLDVDEQTARLLQPGSKLVLKDLEGADAGTLNAWKLKLKYN